MKKKILAVLLVLALCVGTVALAADEPTTLTVKEEQMLLPVGSTDVIDLRVSPHAARSAGVTWQSGDETILEVNDKGHIKGLAVGACDVTITSVLDPSVTVTVHVQVIVPVKKIIPDAGDAKVYVGGTLPLSVSYEPADATLQQVAYASAKESVATVSPEGVVTGVKRGTAEIVITSADGHATVKQRIDVLQPVSAISITAKKTCVTVGKHIDLSATVEPSDASNKKVIWSSSDEEIASVDQRGRVTSYAPGEVIITAACEDDPSVSASVVIEDEQLAESVAFADTEVVVKVGETVTPGYTVLPEDTSNQAVTFQSSHTHIASVDDSGAVTGVKAGKTTLYVYTADGTKHYDHILVTVVQPVTGVSMSKDEVRVGVDYHTKIKAVLEPSDATDRTMTWVSSDESVATVTGTTNEPTIRAHRWGDCVVTGTTADGGFTTSITVHGGSFNHAIRVVAVSIRNGKPHITLENVSNLTITRISYMMTGYDSNGDFIAMSTRPNVAILVGSYDLPLEPGERTEHGKFSFHHLAQYTDLQRLDFTVTDLETADGFAYHIPESRQKTVQYFTDLYLDK